jgi:hypothetical protein
VSLDLERGTPATRFKHGQINRPPGVRPRRPRVDLTHLYAPETVKNGAVVPDKYCSTIDADQESDVVLYSLLLYVQFPISPRPTFPVRAHLVLLVTTLSISRGRKQK